MEPVQIKFFSINKILLVPVTNYYQFLCSFNFSSWIRIILLNRYGSGSTALRRSNADSHHCYERHDLLIISRSRVSSISYSRLKQLLSNKNNCHKGVVHLNPGH